MSLTLVIGSKKWSSWSLRPWIALKQAGIPFKEILIHLRQADTRARILEYCPAGKLPILIDGKDVIWESLAILDYIALRFPEAKLWPAELSAFAVAKSVAAEMHSGFPAIRRELSMDIGADLPTPDLSEEARAELDRLRAIWCDARTRFGSAGPFLFGRFTNADAMYAPMATRLRTYQVDVDPICRAYMNTVLSLPVMREWYRAAAEEEAD